MSDNAIELKESKNGECCGNCGFSSPTGFWYPRCELYDATIMVPGCTHNLMCGEWKQR